MKVLYSILTFKGLDEEQTLEALMEGEADCQEIETHEDGSIELTGAPTDLYKMKDAIEAACPDAEFDVEEIATTPQEYVSLEGEDMELFERLMDLLNACDDVDKIYHNVENYEGKVVAVPAREDIDVPVNETLIVAFAKKQVHYKTSIILLLLLTSYLLFS